MKDKTTHLYVDSHERKLILHMCCLQINRLSEREEVENAKTKCADTFLSD